jgi:hypothetical protein
MVAGVAIAVLPTLLAAWYGRAFVGTIIALGALALLVLGVGVVLRFLPAEAANSPGRLLGLVLVLGGVGGLFVALTGMALTLHWSDELIDWLREGKREGAWQVLLAMAVFLAGLFVMFLTLQLGRAEEHTNPNLRRLTYGYNAVFGGILLLLILAVANVLVGIKVAWAVDATSSGEFTLSERTVNLLKGLDKPLNIYVIWPDDDPDTLQPIRSLLDGFQDRSPQVHIDYISPGLNSNRIEDLLKKYPRKIESVGVLLVYGEEKPENATFLKRGDLFEEGFGNQPTRFRGEDKIDAALSALVGGGSKTIIYGTQGLGEPSLSDTSPRPINGAGEGGLGVLKDRLTARGNFDVRPLKLTAAEPKIPDDCGVLVVANPRPPVDALVARAIHGYLVDRKGKAVVLTDVPSPPTGDKMPATGLEGVLSEFGVEVTGDRILTIGARQVGDQFQVFGADSALFEPNPQLVQAHSNEIATAFANTDFQFFSARVVRPLAGPSRRPEILAQALLVTRQGPPVWAEPKWDADTRDMVRGVAREDAAALNRLAKEPLSVAVAVTDAGKPRLVVFGDTTFVTNREVGERSGTRNFSLFASTLDWLAERPTSIGIEPRNMAIYQMQPTARGWSLVVMPGLIALVAILGLGLGVWAVRRR